MIPCSNRQHLQTLLGRKLVSRDDNYVFSLPCREAYRGFFRRIPKLPVLHPALEPSGFSPFRACEKTLETVLVRGVDHTQNSIERASPTEAMCLTLKISTRLLQERGNAKAATKMDVRVDEDHTSITNSW
ncbi:MAG: hypothetical protein ABEL04_08990, partial [Salinibacter sp.]|uniref:hypothetical protein n=1 Tax=Salinibacter sp. TaxID=2065818 RepID=UPI0035D526E8